MAWGPCPLIFWTKVEACRAEEAKILGEGLSCERGGDAHRLAEGCKFRILVSLNGVLGKTPLYLAVKILFRVVCEKSLYFLFFCVLKWSLLGVKKAWATPRLVSFRDFF